MCNARLLKPDVEQSDLHKNLHLLQSLAIKLPQTNPPIGSCHREANRIGETKPKVKARGTAILVSNFVLWHLDVLTVVLVLKTNH